MILRTDCILTGETFDEVAPGLVCIEDGEIVALGRDVSPGGETVTDLRRGGRYTVLVPGLIDAHCHLELSLLAGRIKFRGSLVRWLGELVLKRPKRWQTQARAVCLGARQSLEHGTTCVADISANGRSWRTLAELPIRKVVFSEVIGIGRRTARGLHAVETKVRKLPPETPLLYPGLSPHAPYSTAPDVYRCAMALAQLQHLRLATHLAEDPAELQFVRTGRGPWRRVLKALRVWDASIHPHGGTPVQWARELGLLAAPALLAHVNYVTDADIELLAQGRAAVVYCPLAHRYFRHAPHRYRDMLAAGVNVALGNDSAGCCGELSILNQMRTVHAAGGLDARQVLAMGTTAAAKALGLDDRIGAIQPGRRADLTVISVDKHAHGPHDQLLASVLGPDSRVEAVLVDGRQVPLGQSPARVGGV